MNHKIKVTGKVGQEQVFLDGKQIFPASIDISLDATKLTQVKMCFHWATVEVDFEVDDKGLDMKKQEQ